MKEKIEAIKDLIANTSMTDDGRLKIQGALSALRTDLLQLERRVFEAETRQNVYAEISEKMLNLMAARHYD